jgi:hypothetical protein
MHEEAGPSSEICGLALGARFRGSGEATTYAFTVTTWGSDSSLRTRDDVREFDGSYSLL